MRDEQQEFISRVIKNHRTPDLPYGPHCDHVFDPFIEGEKEYFFHYVGGAMIWMIRPTLDPTERTSVVEAAGGDSERLSPLFMPPPLPPSEPVPPSPHEGVSACIFQGPLWYRGREFIWFFSNDDGWQLAMHAGREDEPLDAV